MSVMQKPCRLRELRFGRGMPLKGFGVIVMGGESG